MNNNFLSTKEVAERLGVNKMTVLRLIASNKLIAHKVGHRLIRIYEEDLNSFIKGTVMGDGATKTNNEEKK